MAQHGLSERRLNRTNFYFLCDIETRNEARAHGAQDAIAIHKGYRPAVIKVRYRRIISIGIR